ncbi:NrsF family protein [Mesorhizobium sp. A556]
METQELIKMLGKDARVAEPSLALMLLGAVVLSGIIAASIFFGFIGPRPDIHTAATTFRFLLKFVVNGTLVITAFASVVALARPGCRMRSGLAPLLLLAPAIIATAVLVEFTMVPSVEWWSRWIGTNSIPCMTLIPLMAIGPLAVILAALRYGAPTRPRLAGAVAGLLAGGIAATLYAAHCPDDSPFFVATWYTLAIAMLALLGAWVGGRVLRW